MRVRFGECVLDSETRELRVRGTTVHVSPKAFQFLELLLENRPRALSKDEIHEKLWPGTFVGGEKLESPALLSDGDELKLGSVALKFRVFPLSGSTATAED